MANFTFLSKSIQDMDSYGATMEWGILCTIRHTKKEKYNTVILGKEQCSERKVMPVNLSLDFSLTALNTLILIYFSRTVRDTPRRDSSCPLEKVGNALEAVLQAL